LDYFKGKKDPKNPKVQGELRRRGVGTGSPEAPLYRSIDGFVCAWTFFALLADQKEMLLPIEGKKPRNEQGGQVCDLTG
jgi:hypothetical protein